MDQIWWNHIIKAHKFLEDIVAAAAGGSSILVSLPVYVPWKKTLIDIVSDRLRMENSKNKIDVITCPPEQPGVFLLNRYCKEEIRAKYRYGVSYAEFLGKCQETVLNDRYIWVSDIPAAKIDEWIEFVTEYTKGVKNKTPGIFVLEVHDNAAVARKTKKGMQNIIFNHNIGAYDKYAFCTLASSGTRCKEYLRPYLAEIVSSLCDDDMELCAACVAKGAEFLEMPYEVVQKLVKEAYRSDGERYSFTKSKADVEVFVWEAQLKYIFPLVESYRKYFILHYNNTIKAVLPISNSNGEVADMPEDVEIGTLFYLVNKGDIVIPAQEYTDLKFYRNARNRLAHMNPLSNKDVDAILKAGKHEG